MEDISYRFPGGIRIEGRELVRTFQSAIENGGPVTIRIGEKARGKIVDVDATEEGTLEADVLVEPLSELEIKFKEVLDEETIDVERC